VTPYFLVPALFLPRTTLLLCWFLGELPLNSTPFWADFCAALLFPRLLIAYWAWESGAHPIWALIFMGAEVVTRIFQFSHRSNLGSSKEKRHVR
jgi:hypothetical protein